MRMYVEVPMWNKRAVEIFNALKRSGEIALDDLIAAARGRYGEDLFNVYSEEVGFALKEADRKTTGISDFYLVVDGKVVLNTDAGENYNLGEVDMVVGALLLQRARRIVNVAYNG